MPNASHNSHQTHLLHLMEREEMKALIKGHNLRRSISPLRLWRESRGTAINIHENRLSGIMRPLGSIRSSRRGHLVVEYNYSAATEQHRKLNRFAEEFASRNNLVAEHRPFRTKR